MAVRSGTLGHWETKGVRCKAHGIALIPKTEEKTKTACKVRTQEERIYIVVPWYGDVVINDIIVE